MRSRSFLSLFASALLLSACTSITVPNTRVCATAGVITAGANCAETLTDWTGELTFDEWVEFLEPKQDPPRGPALCQSADDWNAWKTTLELACQKLGRQCSREMKETLAKVSANIEALKAKSMKSRRRRANHQ